MKKALLLATAILSAAPAWAGWELVGKSVYGDFYFDPATIRVTGNLRRVWTLVNLNEPEELSNARLRSLKILDEYDCEEKRVRALQSTSFELAMGTGKPVVVSGAQEWRYTSPESIAGEMLNAACSRRAP